MDAHELGEASEATLERGLDSDSTASLRAAAANVASLASTSRAGHWLRMALATRPGIRRSLTTVP